jgi:hypothetical protein
MIVFNQADLKLKRVIQQLTFGGVLYVKIVTHKVLVTVIRITTAYYLGDLLSG